VTECQGCGAWNDTSRTLCVLCGTPLAETDEWDTAAELPPLPPLPDGGLGASMPAWLREAPQPVTSALVVDAAAQPQDLTPLGPRADPRTFLSDDDFPRWLRELAARREGAAAESGDGLVSSGAVPAVTDRPAPWPSWPGLTAGPHAGAMAAPSPNAAAPDQALAAPDALAPPAAEPVLPAAAPEPPPPALSPPPDGRPPAAVVAARALEERRDRGAWETLLLVLLFIGVVVAALWALVSNGVFSPGL
jgi:hypothetical protein